MDGPPPSQARTSTASRAPGNSTRATSTTAPKHAPNTADEDAADPPDGGGGGNYHTIPEANRRMKHAITEMAGSDLATRDAKTSATAAKAEGSDSKAPLLVGVVARLARGLGLW